MSSLAVFAFGVVIGAVIGIIASACGMAMVCHRLAEALAKSDNANDDSGRIDDSEWWKEGRAPYED